MPPTSPRAYLVEAERHLARGDAAAAARNCRMALVLAPAEAMAHYHLAALAAQRRDDEGAAARFARLARLLPGNAVVLYNLAICLRRLERHEPAVAALRRALALDPAAPGSLSALCQSLERLGQAAAGLTLASRLAAVAPADPAALATAGYAAWRAGDPDRAGRWLEAALRRDPDNATALLNLGNLRAAAGALEPALAAYRAAARSRPADPGAWHNVSVTLGRMGRWRDAAEAAARHLRLRRGRPVNDDDADPFPELPAEPAEAPGGPTAWHQLKHDLEQLEYLRRHGLIPAAFDAEIDGHRRVLDGLDEPRRRAISFDLTAAERALVANSRGRLVHLARTGWGDAPALNPELDWPGIERDYLAASPRVIHADGFLRPPALAALRRFCLGSTIWFQLKGAGYLGAYFREGFSDPLLVRIAEELAERLPRVLAPHPLRMIWAYSYEQSMVGINPHADFAAVNVNFWITPDDANLDPDSGGLLVYRKPAPAEWGFEDYNAAPGEAIRRHLGADADRPIRTPHRANRALIFDSRLFHETDRMAFKPGFENRRINVTMLFGDQG